MKPVIALLTDFGSRDPYVGAMKAVIASRCDAQILDLTHEILPFDVFEAAFYLRDIVAYLDKRQFIVVAVVDPGVGTERRILAMERAGQVFLAPDNGLLSLVGSEENAVHSIENQKLFLPRGSSTFHGRDRFAPVAAAIANGTPVASLGPRVTPIQQLDYAPPRIVNGVTLGRVISIDRYGNAITDVPAPSSPNTMTLSLRGRKIKDFATTYEAGRSFPGPFLIVGSRGTLEISVAGASAADLLQIARFDPVELTVW